jgi:hypothetical protein
MEPSQPSLFFEDGNPGSIQAICSRLGAQMGRKYVTQRQGSGVRVWRVE